MSEQEITAEIFDILEVKIMRRKIGFSEVRRLQDRLVELIEMLPEGPGREKTLQKIQDKQRFCYYINDTGILDFTGYGKSFW